MVKGPMNTAKKKWTVYWLQKREFHKNGIQTNKASLKDVTKEASEEKEAIKQKDLRMIDQNQVTLKDGNHGQRANGHYKEEVNSLLTIKREFRKEIKKKNGGSSTGKIPQRGVRRNRRCQKDGSSNLPNTIIILLVPHQ